MKTIEQLLNDTVAVEGGYSNNPNDKGGETNFGVTKATAVANGYTGDMKAMTKAQALEIYRQQYFFKPGFGLIMPLSSAVAGELFDTGVNMGPTTAATFFQRLLNVFNYEGKHYADITVSGSVGPDTVAAFRSFLAKRGQGEGESVMLKGLNALQGERYVKLAEGRSANETFVFGWLNNRVSMGA